MNFENSIITFHGILLTFYTTYFIEKQICETFLVCHSELYKQLLSQAHKLVISIFFRRKKKHFDIFLKFLDFTALRYVFVNINKHSFLLFDFWFEFFFRHFLKLPLKPNIMAKQVVKLMEPSCRFCRNQYCSIEFLDHELNMKFLI